MQKLDLSNKQLKLKNINIPHAPNAAWRPEKKIEVVTTWLTLGSIRQTAGITGVSYGLIKKWRTEPWWKDVENEIIASRRIQQSSKLSAIVDKSLSVIDDRLDNGDFVYNSKAGTLDRKPVSLRDATTAANALMQRAAIIEKLNKDEQVVEATQTIQEQLAALAVEFAKFNKKDNSKAVPIDFKETNDAEAAGGNDDAIYEEREPFPIEENVNALHEKWETGLQEGSGEIYVETLSGEEENGTECGSSGDGTSWQGSQGGREASGSHQAPL